MKLKRTARSAALTVATAGAIMLTGCSSDEPRYDACDQKWGLQGLTVQGALMAFAKEHALDLPPSKITAAADAYIRQANAIEGIEPLQADKPLTKHATLFICYTTTDLAKINGIVV